MSETCQPCTDGYHENCEAAQIAEDDFITCDCVVCEPEEIIFDEFDLGAEYAPAYLPAQICQCEKPMEQICYCAPEARAAREKMESDSKRIEAQQRARLSIGYYDDELPLSSLLDLMRTGLPFSEHVEGWRGV